MQNSSYDDIAGLIEACINKDTAAWAAFVRKYSGLIHFSIDNRVKQCGLTLPRHDIEDIMQDVLKSIWKNNRLEDVKNTRSIPYWLSIVAGNSAIGYIRRLKRRGLLNTVSLSGAADDPELPNLFYPNAELPPDELSRKEISEKILSAIDSLGDKEKLVLKLNVFHGKKYREIAEILNMPRGTVSSYLNRSKEKLKNDLKDFLK